MAETIAAAATQTIAQPIAIPVRKILPWAILGALVAFVAYYFVGADGGATNLFQSMGIHEWFHDARHLLGFPCH